MQRRLWRQLRMRENVENHYHNVMFNDHYLGSDDDVPLFSSSSSRSSKLKKVKNYSKHFNTSRW